MRIGLYSIFLSLFGIMPSETPLQNGEIDLRPPRRKQVQPPPWGAWRDAGLVEEGRFLTLTTLHAAGFEPAMSLRITDYESVAFDHSAMHAAMQYPRFSHNGVVLTGAHQR